MPEVSIVAIFLVGLLGGTHCAAMCGGIVGAFSLQLPASAPKWRLHLAYNAGRIFSYGVAGAIAGAVGAGSLLLKGVLPVREALYVLANVMLMALGLYLAGIWHGVGQIERAGALLWQHVQPYTRKFLPLNSVPRALALGTLWGWLPCGLVYSVLFTALMTGSAAYGGMLMLAFGAGTLPNLLAMGHFAARLQPLLKRKVVRLAAGLGIAGFGMIGLVKGVAHPFGLADFCALQ